MSWNFEITAPSKADAIAELTVKETEQAPHFPGKVAEAIREAIFALPNNDSLDVRIKTHGHIDQHSGSLAIEVLTVARDSGRAAAA